MIALGNGLREDSSLTADDDFVDVTDERSTTSTGFKAHLRLPFMVQMILFYVSCVIVVVLAFHFSLFNALPPTTTIERQEFTVTNDGDVINQKRNGGVSRRSHRRVAKQISRRTETESQTQRSSRPRPVLLRRPQSRIEPHHWPTPPRSPPRIDDSTRLTETRTRALNLRPINTPLSRSPIRPLAIAPRQPLPIRPQQPSRRIVDSSRRIAVPLPVQSPRWSLGLPRPTTNNILTAPDRILPRTRTIGDARIIDRRPLEMSEAEIEQAVINAIIESSTVSARRRTRIRRPQLRLTSALPSSPMSNTQLTRMQHTSIVSNTAQMEDVFERPFGSRSSTISLKSNMETEAIIPALTTTPMTIIARVDNTAFPTSSIPLSSRRISIVSNKESSSRMRSRSRALHKHSSFSSSVAHFGSAGTKSVEFATEPPTSAPTQFDTFVRSRPITVIGQDGLFTDITTRSPPTDRKPTLTFTQSPSVTLISDDDDELFRTIPFDTDTATDITEEFTFTTSPSPSATLPTPLTEETTTPTLFVDISDEFTTTEKPGAPLDIDSSGRSIEGSNIPSMEGPSNPSTEEPIISSMDGLHIPGMEDPSRPGADDREGTEKTIPSTPIATQIRGPPAPPPPEFLLASTRNGEFKEEELNRNIIEGEQSTVLPPAPIPSTKSFSIQEIGAPGAEPPNDTVVAELNKADDFMEVARRLQLIRSNFIRDRQRRSAKKRH
ncbi:unnamed protein product [Cylicocyclus nassatus]|uniref:Uncharacterized protein n=1 Tax=Cylicocyclus nassatus TaxID=53992 RepID=A0AA36DS27_CYLNA|nr:unnamed protein product [Cylicocyclus nassatus]